MKPRIITALILAAAAAGCIVTFIVMKNVPVSDPCAEIRLNGEVIRRVSLAEDCEFTVDCGNGSNTIKVADGAVSVVAADCPDKVCVSTGALSGGVVPIICLPHRLEIVIVSGEDIVDTAVY